MESTGDRLIPSQGVSYEENVFKSRLYVSLPVNFVVHWPFTNIDIIQVNTLMPRQNRRHFADDIFQCISMNQKFCILIQNSLKFVPKVRINNIPALVQKMAWRRSGDKPLSEPMLTHFTDAYAALGGDVLIGFITNYRSISADVSFCNVVFCSDRKLQIKSRIN